MNYQDQALALQDPSCAVREPTRPDDYMEAERDIDAKAEQAGVKGSGLSASEYAMARERGEGILRNNPPPDASESEQSAVNAKAVDLKPLMGIQDQPAQRAMKPAAAPAPTPAPARCGHGAAGSRRNERVHRQERSEAREGAHRAR